MLHKKKIILDYRAKREIVLFPKKSRIKIRAYISILEEKGILKDPFAKKLFHNPALFEMRVKTRENWRVVYSLLNNQEIIILSAFLKKTQKTPIREIQKAKRRLLQYL